MTVAGKSFYLSETGCVTNRPENTLFCDGQAFSDTLLRVCDNSVFAHTAEAQDGFISLKGGIRAGVCGDFSGGGMPVVTSINLRVPRQVTGCADPLLRLGLCGMLIAGPPGSGKTTVLRDLIRSLSLSGNRITVIDSRREISGGAGEYAFDLGDNTDVMFISDRAKGAQMALRSMYPQIIAFDEVGTLAEVRALLEAFNSGVCVITTAHAGAVSDMAKRPVTRELIASGIIEKIAFLPGGIGQTPGIFDANEVINGSNT